MSRIAAPVGEVITPMRRGTSGSARLRSSGEQALGRQPRLEFVERTLQGAEPGILEMLDQQLIIAARLVQAHAAEGDHRLALARRKARTGCCGCGTWRSAAARRGP